MKKTKSTSGESFVIRKFHGIYGEEKRYVLHYYRQCLIVEYSIFYRTLINCYVDYYDHTQTEQLFMLYNVKKPQELFKVLFYHALSYWGKEAFFDGMHKLLHYQMIVPKHFEFTYHKDKDSHGFKRCLLDKISHIIDK